MVIKKIINNNIISARDDKGIELVAMGKGIGFGRRAGEEVEESKIEKVFRLENIDDTEYFKSLLASLPIEFVRLSNQIISYAKETLGFELNSNIYLGLTDHINFAIERQKKGMVFSNALHDEIKLFYPNEYLVGKHALYLIENQTGNPGMAKGGSGDVLAGMILSLLGQGFPLKQAVPWAVCLHGKAGDLAAEERGEYGMTPMDLVERIPAVIKNCEG